MQDDVFEAFLETAAEDAAYIGAHSDILRVEPVSGSGRPPSAYLGILEQVEHLRRDRDGRVRASTEPVRFRVDFPRDYCQGLDPGLQYRVVRVGAPLVHPNAKRAGGCTIVCLGSQFAPATRLRTLVQQIYAVVAGRGFATRDALDAEARRYYLSHLEEIRALRAAPLWRPLAARVRVQGPGDGATP